MVVKRVVAGAATLAALLTAFLAGTASAAPSSAAHLKTYRACSAKPAPGHAACFAKFRMLEGMLGKKAHRKATPSGYGPSELRSAYQLPATGANGRTVAIVDAFDDPTAEKDLGTYRQQYGLPACTSANGCFKKVDQNGGTSYPSKDAGWALEISLDLDMVSAACGDCKITLVEAKSASFADLGTAVQQAAKQGAYAISNSYGSQVDASDADYGRYYKHPGIAVTASTGDSGYMGGSYPASSSYVTAVGGTSLSKASNARGWSESAWSGAGSGCSLYNAAIPAASGFDTGCGSKRGMADVSAVADPNTGVAVYDSTPYQGQSGWFTVGGTSASSPIIAGVYGLGGNVPSTGYSNALPYQNAGKLYDVTTGSNGVVCLPLQLCNARAGWDGPTGLGTPHGVGAF
ncbi:MAG: S53 family peptidase [Streptosporangiales bacterium]|nr:S53 family peptidase [Streptosporangiales bacterium]MBO0890918.1 S53 family peptidase [Acidothermales bacterium]